LTALPAFYTVAASLTHTCTCRRLSSKEHEDTCCNQHSSILGFLALPRISVLASFERVSVPPGQREAPSNDWPSVCHATTGRIDHSCFPHPCRLGWSRTPTCGDCTCPSTGYAVIPSRVVSPVVHVRGGSRDMVSWTTRRVPCVHGSSWLHPSLACLYEGGTAIRQVYVEP
jgi:hypothetical protein